MNQGKYIFTQLTEFLPQRIFNRLGHKYDSNKHIKRFSSWNQLLSMIFGQMSGRDSLRDLMISIEPHKTKFYHLVFGKGTSRSNFANINEKRDCRIFEEYAFHLIDLAKKSSIMDHDFLLNINGNIYDLDSSTIDLCLSVFKWATFFKTKGRIKLRTLYNIKTSIPCFIHVSPASLHDVNVLDLLYFEPGGYYILDPGYINYERLLRIHQSYDYFVIRAKDNLHFRRFYSNKINKDNGVLLDQIVKLTGFYVLKKYPEKLRRIKFYDEETDNELIFLSNN
jgi:hypothetical protein